MNVVHVVVDVITSGPHPRGTTVATVPDTERGKEEGERESSGCGGRGSNGGDGCGGSDGGPTGPVDLTPV